MVIAMLIFSIIALIVSIIGIKWHISLYDMLDTNAEQVEYIDWLLSSYLVYLLTPASVFGIISCTYILIVS